MPGSNILQVNDVVALCHLNGGEEITTGTISSLSPNDSPTKVTLAESKFYATRSVHQKNDWTIYNDGQYIGPGIINKKNI